MRNWYQVGPVAVILVAGLAAAALLAASPERAAAAQYSSIVIDAGTGNILSEYNADSPNYPASLTKMMTLYLTFQALEQKSITLETRFAVSPHAAAQEPTKLNLVPGSTISVHDLILGLVTQSANDAAVVLAEGLGGSESAFADRMTREAHALGMGDTNFHNASGLPDPLQRTTARDLAMLARHLYLDFPREYPYFATEDFTYRGVTYTNHNHLMSAFAGMDGIKTGFIRASGFNLAASAVRNHRRLIGIVMGGQSAHARDMKMAALLNAAFEGRAPSEVQVAVAHRPAAPRLASATAFGNLARHAVRTLSTLAPIARAEAATPARHPAGKEWSVQLGSFKQRKSAARAVSAALSRLPADRGKPVAVIASRTHKGAIYLPRILDLSASQAQDACHVLHRDRRVCAVVGPVPQMAAHHPSRMVASRTLKTAVE